MSDRAAQFSPFAALNGYDAAIQETGRFTDEKIDLDESEFSILDQKLQELLDCLDDEPKVVLTYFAPDMRKTGGKYVNVIGTVKKVDITKRQIILQDGTTVCMENILEIQICA